MSGSSLAWKRAKLALAGGVNSPVRAFKAVGGEPVFIKSGAGAYLTDNRGKRYVDFCMSWGALLMGHAFAGTVKAVQKQAQKGLSFGASTEIETELAEEIKKTFTHIERLRFTSSGTEAVMAAVRLARGFTRRKRVLKFEGCYHGHADSLLVKAGSGLATFSRSGVTAPSSAGVPQELANLTSVLPYNDVEEARKFIRRTKDLACVIIEPVAGNMGVVLPRPGYLDVLRQETRKAGALLILDEVMTGYRVGFGGAQHIYGIIPDITILGKIIGAGMPIGAFGARREIMDCLSPLGNVYQAGTLSGNPLSMAAGLSVLRRLSKNFYSENGRRIGNFLEELRSVMQKKNKDIAINHCGMMFTLFFKKGSVDNFSDAARSDSAVFGRFFRHMLSKGIYLPPSAFEASFFSSAHSAAALQKTLEAAKSW